MTYQFPFYVIALAAAVSLGLIILTVVLVRKDASLKAKLVSGLLAVLAAVIITPALALDKVVLDEVKLQQTTGFWFSPTKKGFVLADVASVHIGTAVGRKNREYEVWNVNYQNGTTESIDPGDLWILHRADIIARLRERGLTVR